MSFKSIAVCNIEVKLYAHYILKHMQLLFSEEF